MATRHGAVESELRAARDDGLRRSGLDHPRANHDGIEARGALAVDRDGGNGGGQARRQRDEPRRISAAANGVAENHLINSVGIQL